MDDKSNIALGCIVCMEKWGVASRGEIGRILTFFLCVVVCGSACFTFGGFDFFFFGVSWDVILV